MSQSHLRCSLLTPPGRGAIAVVAAFGDQAMALIENLFESVSGKSLSGASDRSIMYGRWRTTDEDVVVTKHSNRLEIHCHGGQAAPAAILNSLVEVGFTIIELKEAAGLLFDNDWQSEVALALAQAATERTAEILMGQFQIAAEALVQLETQLSSNQDAQCHQARETIERSLKLSKFGMHLTKAWSVVLCGRPNVGKSSLINALVGFERAIVHPEAGTTRDVVTQLTAVEGWPIELKDTAGLRRAQNEIERQGIELTRAEIESADLVIAVFEASELDDGRLDWDFIRENRAGLVAVNKIDLLYADAIGKLNQENDRPECRRNSPIDVVPVSATERQGIQALVSAIARTLVPVVPEGDQLIPISPQQIKWLQSKAAQLGKTS